MTRPKLTPLQVEALRAVALGEVLWLHGYDARALGAPTKSVLSLRRREFVEWPYRYPLSRITLTPAGREALAQYEQEQTQ